jgi:hypothetical protein
MPADEEYPNIKDKGAMLPLEAPSPDFTTTGIAESPSSLPPSTDEDEEEEEDDDEDDEDDDSANDDSTFFGGNDEMHRDGSSSVGSSSKVVDPRNGGGSGVEQGPEKGHNHILKLITRQAEAVYSTRTLVSLILLGLAVGFAFAFYILVLREEKKQFKQEVRRSNRYSIPFGRRHLGEWKEGHALTGSFALSVSSLFAVLYIYSLMNLACLF